MNSAKSCRQCESFQSAGFSMINAQSLRRLDQYKSPKSYKKNHVIFRQSEVAQSVYCLRSGLVKLETVSKEGAQIVVGYLKGGDLLGMGAVLSGDLSSVTAYVVEDAVACAFSAEFFRTIIRESPDLALNYMARIMFDLRQTQLRLMSGVEKGVTAKVAESLVYLKENFEDHRFTRREIAEWAGTSTESVIRTLSSFESEKIISQMGRSIIILDKNALLHIAGNII